MSDAKNLNENGNHEGEFTLGVGGWAEYTVHMTETTDTIRHDVVVPPDKVIPVIFLPGVMGSNLRMTKERQEKLKRTDNRAWRPDDISKTDVVKGQDLEDGSRTLRQHNVNWISILVRLRWSITTTPKIRDVSIRKERRR